MVILLYGLIRCPAVTSLAEVPGYATNFEKVGSILLSACVSVCPSVQKIKARVLKFHIWIPRQKIAYPYIFSCPNYLPLLSYAPLRCKSAIM